MSLLREAMKSIAFDEFIGTKFEKYFSLKEVKKKNIWSLYGEPGDRAFYVLDGRLKIFSYFSDDREFNWEFEEGTWMALETVISNVEYDFDIEALTDALVLEVPLKKILDEYPDLDFYKKVMTIMSDFIIFQATKASLMINYSGEELFMKYMALNDYSIDEKSIWEIAFSLNLKLRTFQRVLKKLTDLGIIEKEGKKIFVKDMEKYEKHLKELEISEEV